MIDDSLMGKSGEVAPLEQLNTAEAHTMALLKDIYVINEFHHALVSQWVRYGDRYILEVVEATMPLLVQVQMHDHYIADSNADHSRRIVYITSDQLA